MLMEEEFTAALDSEVVVDSLESRIEPVGIIVAYNKFEALTDVQEESDQYSSIPSEWEEHLFIDHIRKVEKLAKEINSTPVVTRSQGKKKVVNQLVKGPVKGPNIKSKGKPKGAKEWK